MAPEVIAQDGAYSLKADGSFRSPILSLSFSHSLLHTLSFPVTLTLTLLPSLLVWYDHI